MMLDCEFIMFMIYIYEDIKIFIIVLGYKIKKKSNYYICMDIMGRGGGR